MTSAGVDVLYGDELDGRQVCLISQQSAAEEAVKVVSRACPNRDKETKGNKEDIRKKQRHSFHRDKAATSAMFGS